MANFLAVFLCFFYVCGNKRETPTYHASKRVHASYRLLIAELQKTLRNLKGSCGTSRKLQRKLSQRDPNQQKNAKNRKNIQKSVKNTSKVASYGRFDLKMGTGLKFPAKPTPLELHSSHGDPFRDQTRFQKRGVNQGSNFPGPTPKTKVAADKYCLTFF